MNREFNAIFENGLLRPLEPISLPEHEVVRISVLTKTDTDAARSDDQTGKSLYDAFVEAGLLGCVKDGPPDLSTNPKYMEGFGESADSN